jgi:hypothetical protein
MLTQATQSEFIYVFQFLFNIHLNSDINFCSKDVCVR